MAAYCRFLRMSNVSIAEPFTSLRIIHPQRRAQIQTGLACGLAQTCDVVHRLGVGKRSPHGAPLLPDVLGGDTHDE